MVNILLLSFLQWAFVITLPENQKTNCNEKKVSCNSLDSCLLQLTMKYMTKYISATIQVSPVKISNSKKRFTTYKKVYSFFHVFMIPHISVKLIGLLQKNKKQQSALKRRSRWYNLILLQCFQRWGCTKTFF